MTLKKAITKIFSFLFYKQIKRQTEKNEKEITKKITLKDGREITFHR